MLGQLVQIWNGSSWDNSSQQNNTYCNTACLSTQSTYGWGSNNTWQRGDSLTNFCSSLAGIAKYTGNNLQVAIYPNPSAGMLTINSVQEMNEVRITDLIGQLVCIIKPNSTKADLTIVRAGAYFVQVTTGAEITTQKIIVTD